ncbi:DNA-directed RNA polymerase subunit omega [Pelagibacteraceae bacterium]|nr:DNA-directed RNA polymerase subunit omega [Pelagibacteraceae bacterium]
MARITVEDCLEKIDSQYDLVLLAKERTSQLNAGELPLVPKDDDKNTVISLREIGEGKVSVKTLEDAAINKFRKQQEEVVDVEDLEDINEDSFDKVYKGEVSKSGTAILPSKRLRRIPDKVNLQDKKEEKLDEETLNQEDELKEASEETPLEKETKPE